MNILIVGAGTVGTHLAESLLVDGHTVVVVDAHPNRVGELEEQLDLSAIEGSGTDHDVLRRADVEKMDVAIAVTSIDEVNLITALTCKRLGAIRAIARVRNPDLVHEAPVNYRELCEVDLIISPEVLTARQIAKFLENPDAIEMESFAHGMVQMQQVQLLKPCEVLGKPLSDAGFPNGVLVAGIRRGDEIMIPDGSVRLHLDDTITLVGTSEGLEEAEPLMGQTTPEAKHVVILGGGHVGEELARILETRDTTAMLIERDERRAKLLSERLRKTTVVLGDATNIDVLREERVGGNDVFVAATGDDEENIMATVLARELGVPQSIVLVHRPDYASVIQRMGFDHVLSPREVTARHVASHLRNRLGASAPVLGGGAELIEAVVGMRAPITKKPLRDLKTPKGTLICMIQRDDHMEIPHGDHQIQAGDTVIAMALNRAAKDLRAMLK